MNGKLILDNSIEYCIVSMIYHFIVKLTLFVIYTSIGPITILSFNLKLLLLLFTIIHISTITDTINYQLLQILKLLFIVMCMRCKLNKFISVYSNISPTTLDIQRHMHLRLPYYLQLTWFDSFWHVKYFLLEES